MDKILKFTQIHSFENASVFKFAYDNISVIILVSVLTYLVQKYAFDKRYKNLPPGPTGVPFLGYIPFLGDNPQQTLWDLSKKYGDVMSLRLGSKLTVVFTGYEASKEALNNPAAMDRAPNVFDHIPKMGMETANGEEWVEQRRFSIHAMKNLGLGRGSWERQIMEEVTSFLDGLSSFKGKSVDISDMLLTSINNNIISMLIGRRLQRDTEENKIKLVADYAHIAFTYTGVSQITSLLPGIRKYLEYFKIAGYDKAANIISDVDKWISEEVRKHREEKRGLTDFITLYLEKMDEMQNQKKEHWFNDDNLEGNFRILFLGASDTIFSSLGWLFRLMAQHSDIQKKVQAELDDVIGRDGIISYEERLKIPYTFAVVMEGQRFASIVPLSTTRIAINDFEVQGYTIPKGTFMFANQFAMHFDPKYWKDPEKFHPERFLNDNNTVIKNPPSFASFSLGRRNCPGENIAFMEILVFFTSVLRKFTICMPSGEEPKFDFINGLVIHLKPQAMCFTERYDDT